MNRSRYHRIVFHLTYFLQLAAFAMMWSYANVHFKTNLHFSESVLGFIRSGTILITIILLPFLTSFFDKSNKKSLWMAAAYLTASGAAFLLEDSHSSNAVFALMALFNLSSTLVMTMLPVLIINSMPQGEKRGLRFALTRSSGSLGFTLAAYIAGFYITLPSQLALSFPAAGYFLLACLLLTLPAFFFPLPQPEKKSTGSFYSLLFTKPQLRPLLSLQFLYGVSLPPLFVFFPIYFVQLGGPVKWLSYTFTLMGASAILGMIWVGMWTDRKGPLMPLMWTFAANALRLALFAVLTNPIALVWVNLLHLIIFAGNEICMTLFIQSQVESGDRAKIGGLSAVSGSLGQMISAFACGLIAQHLGYRWLYIFFSILALLLPILLYTKFIRGKKEPVIAC